MVTKNMRFFEWPCPITAKDEDSYIVQAFRIELFSCSIAYKRDGEKEARIVMTPFRLNYSSEFTFLFTTVYTSLTIVNFNAFDS